MLLNQFRGKGNRCGKKAVEPRNRPNSEVFSRRRAQTLEPARHLRRGRGCADSRSSRTWRRGQALHRW